LLIHREQRHPRLLAACRGDSRRRSADAGSTPATSRTTTADGYLYVHGREKDVIIVSGENVIAGEVEDVIQAIEGVREVAVVGVEATGIRAYLGELVKAVVVAEDGAEVGEREVKRACVASLASYQVPQIVEFRDRLPRNPAGKVLKRELT
jgi:acyl-CoA synthetase (AMP-forming)/AMP-acid ligase II